MLSAAAQAGLIRPLKCTANISFLLKTNIPPDFFNGVLCLSVKAGLKCLTLQFPPALAKSSVNHRQEWDESKFLQL